MSYKWREVCMMLRVCGSDANRRRQAKIYSDRIDKELQASAREHIVVAVCSNHAPL